MFVFTRDPSSLGFNSSSHILLGLKLGEVEEVSAVVTKLYEGITLGILTCKLKTGTGAKDTLVLIACGYSLLRVQDRQDKENYSKEGSG